ncbi:glucosylceramidase [Alkalibacterium subtropicum]|uniref:Glucosylceramidase n=1 Tax=Alkalibacterium subtropicum TaxID=753702 RepID=A0A1I1GIZ9_9LACT|nr:glycoside hydrolase family 30 protein [Alkalibacterium subtropicum]SFC11524.1 glucosylceramidase [Alkalibacterium subtropicum]
MTKRTVTAVQSVKADNSFWQPVSIKEVTDNSTTHVTVDSTQTYQTWMGFGGALTESATYTMDQLPAEKKESILQAYYNKENGLGYTLGRLHIASCDFSLENYDYIEENDETLETFNMDREEKWVLPTLRRAQEIAGEPLTLVASPWSPSAWMKTNGERNNGGKLKKEYYTLWAQFIARYLKEMKDKGFETFAITVQNEPAATQTWDSCEFTAEEEAEMVKVLSGVFKEENLDVNIIIWDHNRDIIFERADTVLSDPEANKGVWGVGNHWYMSEDFEALSKVHDKYPDKHMIFTEGCIEGGVQLGAWHTGERYARNIIGDMNNWLEGFLDWNIVLDEQGGPNHVGNYCDAPIIADTKEKVAHYNSSYYFIGHLSKYIRPGAERVDVTLSGDDLSVVAFKNEDGSLVTVLLNETDKASDLVLSLDNEGAAVHVPAHSITTVVSEQA